MKRNLAFFVLLAVLLLFRQPLSAQCTTDAGTLVNTIFTACAPWSQTIVVENANTGVLDTNDVRLYVVHWATPLTAGNVLSWSPSPVVITASLPAGTYFISAVAGNNNGTGFVDFSDPCLSVSNAIELIVNEPPAVTATPSGLLYCGTAGVTINTVVSQPGQYGFFWTNSDQSIVSTEQSPTFTQAGIYFLEVIDSLSGCFASASAVIVSGDTNSVTITPDPGVCDGFTLPVNLEAVLEYPIPGAVYNWSNGGNSSVTSAVTFGQYVVTVTDPASGCTYTDGFVLTPLQQPLGVLIQYLPPSNCVDSIAGLFLSVASGGLSYSALWNTGDQSTYLPNPAPGLYTVTVTSTYGCTATASYFVETAPADCGAVSGRVFADWNSDCAFNGTDAGLAGFVAVFESVNTGEQYYAWTDAQGNYNISLLPDTYTASVQSGAPLWQPCQPSYTVVVDPVQPAVQDFPLQATESCSQLGVEIATGLLRRCFNSYYAVNYSNTGTADAAGAYITLTFDPLLQFVSATVPATNLGGNVYRFDLGTVPYNTSGNFIVTVLVNCNAVLGQVHCTEAEIFPHDPCPAASSLWSGASLEITAECLTDSVLVTFHNTGTADMTVPLDYVIVEDVIMMMQGQEPALSSDGKHVLSLPADGATWYIQAEQEPFHPGLSMPSLTLEGCATGTFTTGLANQFALNDADIWIDEDCTPNQGAYDPNDKQAFPTGYGTEHYIRPGTDLEYLIRFQNTGTDTAFTVVVRDTLSELLDPGTVLPGPASHDYTFEYQGRGALKFTFDDILLPDSNVNVAGSQGFVSFRVKQRPDVPLESLITNKAAIYFDFNEPVITNTVRHRVGENFVTVSSWHPQQPGTSIQVLPNPVEHEAIVTFTGPDSAEWEIEVYGTDGRLALRGVSAGAQWRLQRGTLPAGLYLIRIVQHGNTAGIGKVIVR